MQNKNSKTKLMSGNEAVGEASIQAGCSFYAGYPITPQNELTAYMSKRMSEIGGTFIQAESELAAINMVFGASAAGVRAMTSSSSPGISLKQEGISYLVGCELPAVIVNMMRAGPGLGNIDSAQGDYFQATRGGGHGDYRTIVLAPNSVQEAFDLQMLAFDLADKYRNPTMLLGDAILAQMMEPLSPVTSHQSPVTSKKPWALTGCKDREPNVLRSLFLKEGALEEHNKKLQWKFAAMEKEEIRYEEIDIEDAEIVLVAYGTVSRICRGAMQKARKQGIRIGLFRPITLWPFPEQVLKKMALQRKKFLVVEMSYGQMLEDVKLAVEGKSEVKFYGRGGGGIPQEEEIIRICHKLQAAGFKPEKRND
ncbi:MAG: 3-methyl-2-oxobutanoate dehydrogenase subunit VorB [Candidatus Omnitrophica bacterium]|nr:3-methyl-2-oxobutanoate dehydrogenase subunit VorB [Candidatus Omnitrophota bacterium]